jgi:hypothetical protein
VLKGGGKFIFGPGHRTLGILVCPLFQCGVESEWIVATRVASSYQSFYTSEAIWLLVAMTNTSYNQYLHTVCSDSWYDFQMWLYKRQTSFWT